MRTDQIIYDMQNDPNGITVIIGMYKRPHTLKEQIDAFENQTVKPREIWIVQDGNFFEIPNEYKDKYKVFQCSKNVGVRFRFTVALMARTKYICMQDDDSIPKSRRLENCLTESKKKRGLYGTVGLQMGVCKRSGARDWGEPETRSNYYYSHIRHGRPKPNEQTVEVDLVGHSWFFEKEVLSEYYKQPLNPQFRMCGEDIELGFAHQRLGLGIYVPPHPKDNEEMWGSCKGREYGTKNDSRSVQTKGEGDNDCYSVYWRRARQRGFKTLQDKRLGK